MSAPSAKVAIQAFCQALQLLGLPSLPPEHVRQAKFAAGPDVALWRVLHDALVWSMVRQATQDTTAAAAITRLWNVIAEEHLDDDRAVFAQEGKHFVARQLLECDCPQPLVAAILSDAVSTRHLLLCLVWVTSHSQLLQAALEQVALPVDALLRLPPYPDDTRCSPGTATAYTAAARQAATHAHHLLTHLGQLLQSSKQEPRQAACKTATGLVPACRAQSPQPEQWDVQQVWQCVDTGAAMLLSLQGKSRAALLSLQSHMDAVSRLRGELQGLQSRVWPRAHPLTSFELHLLQHPTTGQQCVAGMQRASQVLAQQQQLLSGGHMFYMWAVSVIQEEAAASREHTLVQEQYGGTSQQVSLTSFNALPEPDTPAAALLLRKLQQQVALASQHVELAGATVTSHSNTGGQAGQQITAQHFRQLARAAIPKPSTGSSQASHPAACQGGGDRYDEVKLWEAPPDVQAVLGAASEARMSGSHRAQQAWAQQQVWQRVGSSVACDVLEGGTERKGQVVPAAASVQDETNRLLEATLSVARSLAHIRGAHKQAMQRVAKQIEVPYLVTGLT